VASFNFDIPGGLEEMLKNLSDNNLGIKAVSSASPIVEKAMKGELSNHHRAERDPTRGEMVESIKATKPKENRYGTYAFVRPTGTDSKGVRNMEKLAYLEYGTARQVGTPVVGKIRDSVSKEVSETMQRVIMQEAGQ